jgi:hypothetical protein
VVIETTVDLRPTDAVVGGENEGDILQQSQKRDATSIYICIYLFVSIKL